jgi:excisionase family DNA binding protein
MNKFLSIQEAAKYLGVSPQTLRRWEKSGRIAPSFRTEGNQRRYDPALLRPFDLTSQQENRPTIAYARVSSQDQKEDLQRQVHMLELYCSAKGWSFSVIQDLGSGMNYHKKGLQQLLDKIMSGKIGRLVLTHKDRLLRFGAELVFSLCSMHLVEVVIIHQGEEPSFEEELAKDVLEVITVFSARLYGSRSRKNKQLLDKLQRAVVDG